MLTSVNDKCVLNYIIFHYKIGEDNIAQESGAMNEQLMSKAIKDQNFRTEVKKNEEKYRTLEQASNYSDTPHMPAGVLKKIQAGNRQIYFYFGYQQPTLKKQMCQVAMYLIKHFKPNVQKPYTLVFFNEKCSDNYVLWNFRQTFGYLKLQQIAALDQFIVVKPYFYHKTMDWMTFGTIPKFIRAHTRFINGYQQLCDHLKIDQRVLGDSVPACLYEHELPELHASKTSLEILRMNIQGQARSQQENDVMFEFQKTIKSMIMKPGYEINNLEDYEISAEGIPVILKMLVFYFDSHKEGLELEGIFRKSVSIDEENETITQILSKNYDYLLDVENPHIIANLIKRFFSSLKTPVFPFDSFVAIMNDQGIKDKVEHMKQTFKTLPQLNKRTLVFIFTFFKQKILKNEHHNKMSSQNIAICFAPCIFRSEKASAADLIYATKGVMYCKFMLTDFQQVFGPKEERDVLYRKSYLETRKTFDQTLDIGLEMAMNIAAENLEETKHSRRVSHKYGEEQCAKIQLQPQQPIEQKKQQTAQQQKQQKQPQKQQQQEVKQEQVTTNAQADRPAQDLQLLEKNKKQQGEICVEGQTGNPVQFDDFQADKAEEGEASQEEGQRI